MFFNVLRTNFYIIIVLYLKDHRRDLECYFVSYYKRGVVGDRRWRRRWRRRRWWRASGRSVVNSPRRWRALHRGAVMCRPPEPDAQVVTLFKNVVVARRGMCWRPAATETAHFQPGNYRLKGSNTDICDRG